MRIADPTQREWDQYEKLFEDEPDIQRVLRFLRLRNQLEVKRCMRIFNYHTTRLANSAFRRKGYPVRILPSPETVNEPLEDRVVHLYEIEVLNIKKASA